jgi:hypothetical protein
MKIPIAANGISATRMSPVISSHLSAGNRTPSITPDRYSNARLINVMT